ncbi:hypothetical protein [Streptomyces sp. NPDC090025]|uniref:hypothetical protein n=1 Tax=Streptomyces sp. NPDC090025 TaxID=3365922 RepID=UPI0038347AC8
MPSARSLLWGGLVAVAAGAVLSVLGWYGISGERQVARQLPYLASCTVPGAALIVAGAVLVAATAPRGRRPRPRPRAQPPVATPWTPSSDGPVLRVPGGTLAHRPDCPLVAGSPDAVPAGDGADPSALAPCPVCEPWPGR